MLILNKYKESDLDEFIDLYSNIVKIDKVKAKNLALHAIQYYSGSKKVRENTCFMQELELRWYKSLETGKPDYSVYNDKYFIFDIWACWVIYSRKYIKELSNKKGIILETEYMSIADDIGKIDSVIDMGNGFGYTTIALKQLFNTKNTYGYNVKDSFQYRFTEYLSRRICGFKEVYNFKTLGKIDMVFASEYFEHIEEPIKHLIDVLNILKPKYLIIANAFNAKSVGHFNQYKHDSMIFTGKKISRLFNQTLRIFGYTKIKTNLWNNRPAYWRKTYES